MQLFRHIFTLLLLFTSLGSYAQGDLLITPKRLVFDGNKRVEEINLANIGKDTATYSLAFIQYKMDDNGSFVLLNDGDSSVKIASKNLRFFPRTVTLAPNEAQSVKVQLIKSNELTDGEYRSHLFFKNVLDNSALGSAPAAAKDSGISVVLKPSFGISIATIIRVGEVAVKGSIADAAFIPAVASNNAGVAFTINRSGNISLYGDIKVSHISTENIRTEVAIMKGLAVYTPNTFRKIKLPLNKIETVNYAKGRLLIEYLEPTGKNNIISSAEIVL